MSKFKMASKTQLSILPIHTALTKGMTSLLSHVYIKLCNLFIPFYISVFLVLNIGTSAQLSVIIDNQNKDEITSEMPSYSMLQKLPYFNDCCLVVAAALTGK